MIRVLESKRGGVAPLAVLLAAGAAAGCGGGGGEAPKPPESANLFAQTFSLPNYNSVAMDEDVQLVLSAPVREGSINPDSFQIRTGASGGIAPYGTFIRGVFMVDPATGNRVVVDPDQATPNLLNRVEQTGDLSRIPDFMRIDLGNDEPRASNGRRRPLFDKSRQGVITFVPEIPTRAALDDTGYTAGSTYTVVVPGYPSTNTLENLDGDQLLSPNNRVFTSTFTIVPSSAPSLFLGSESAGIPRVIHSSPYNGDDEIPVTDTVAIRFSQPLDPRTVLPTAFKVEMVSVPAPYPVVPVSVFLAQQRLDKVEVILTPINPMPPDAAIRVSIDATIEDLLGQALAPTQISFFTGTAPITPPGDVTEDFETTDRLDAVNSTANWDQNKPYVGGLDGRLTAAFAPYAGDGTDGAFAAPIGLTTIINTGSTSQRVYNYTSFSIPIGATVVVQGSHPLVIHCQADVSIAGEIRLNGSNGANSIAGNDVNLAEGGGAGGAAGPGGNAGGNGAMTNGNFDGNPGLGTGGGLGGYTGENDGFGSFTSGMWPRAQYPGGPVQSPCSMSATAAPKSFEPCRIRECGGGGGYALDGGDAENRTGTTIKTSAAATPVGGDGGAAWGDDALSFASTTATVQVLDPANLPSGTRLITLTGIPTLVAGQGGSGGGGGGGEDDSTGDTVHWGVADGSDEGGGGGGGGGGAIQIVAYGSISIAGIISAKGGNGGSSYDTPALTALSQGAGGGGGSGGTVWLQTRSGINFAGGAIVDVAGGIGGQGFADGTTDVFDGGAGSEGRIRFEDSDAIIVNAPANSTAGVFSPALELASTGWSEWQNTGIFTPDYSAPDVTADHHPELAANGTIKVYMEGAPEDVSNVSENPDTLNSTGWILVWDSTVVGGLVAGDPWDLLDNQKWWRFRVDLTVDALHTFTDPLPEVDQIVFNID
jgi:hypothetical protein